MKSILNQKKQEIFNEDIDNNDDDKILPFGRSLKEGLLQVFAQQIASQQINNNELDDWLIVLDSVMSTINSHVNNQSNKLFQRDMIKQKISKYYDKTNYELLSDISKLNAVPKVKCSSVRCKCGAFMKLLDHKQCYDGSGATCDFCGGSIRSQCWHCVKEKEAVEHNSGFDLCVLCAKQPMVPKELFDDIPTKKEQRELDKALNKKNNNEEEEDDDDDDDEDEDKEDEKTDNDDGYDLSFEGDDIDEKCPARHPLIAAFQSTLSASLTSKSTEHLKAMKSYTNILFKHSEKLYLSYMINI